VPIGSTVHIGHTELLLQSMDQKQGKELCGRTDLIVEVDEKPRRPVDDAIPGNDATFRRIRNRAPGGDLLHAKRRFVRGVTRGMNPQNNLPTLHVFINPLVKWVWWGGMVVVMGHDCSAGAQSRGGDGAGASRGSVGAPAGN